MRHIRYHTGSLPKNYEDTQIFAKTLLNHVDVFKANTGLKELVGWAYGNWAVAPEEFDLAKQFDPDLIKYAAIDACATFFLWNRINADIGADPLAILHTESPDYASLSYDEMLLVPPSTSSGFTPMDLLPMPEPKSEDPPPGFFYHFVAKHLISTTIDVSLAGVPMDMSRVESLESTLDDVLQTVSDTLAANPIIHRYQSARYSHLKSSHDSEIRSKMKTASDYLKPFDHKSMDHRSYYMAIVLEDQPWIVPPPTTIPTGIPKWTARDVKKANITIDDTTIQQQAVERWANDKAVMYNKAKDYLNKLAYNETDLLPPFNCSSPDQKHELLTDMLGLKSEKNTDAWIDYERKVDRAFKYGGDPDSIPIPKNQYSWNRDNLERIHKETDDPELKELLQSLIDHSFGAIIKNNFINAFYEYTIDGRLYGQYKLLGAKSARYTSNAPNLLNMPSTGSVYAKPLKKVFKARPGYIIYAIDYSALEDRVMASLSKDTNKCNIFLEGLDGHCLNAYGYFKSEVAEHMDITGDTTADVRQFFDLQENGHKELKAIRQKGKPATFGLSYGSQPPKVSETLKIPLDEATKIFTSYHEELYPGITEYRESYVLTTAEAKKRLHLGMGFYIKTDAPSKDIRTLNNATCQFWSILTALTINKVAAIQPPELDITPISTIYDSIYYEVKKDATTIKWLNDNIVPIMNTPFITDQIIANEAAGELGLDWADLTVIPNDATLSQIQQVLDNL